MRFIFKNVLFCLLVTSYVFYVSAEETEQAEKPRQIVITNSPNDLDFIFGRTDELNYYLRIKTVFALSLDLSEDQIEDCYNFLNSRMENQTLEDLQFNGLKNELTGMLMSQNQKPEKLAYHLVKMAKDESYDSTWRDYCVQFLGKWYPDAPENDGRKAMLDGLWNALENERTSSLAGAASSQLTFLAKNNYVDAEKVSKACYDALADPACSNISKVAVLQACAELNNQDALPIARGLAEKSKDVVLRMSAIAAVGMLGNQEDLPMLEKLTKSRNIYIFKPAQAAIDRINNRKAK